MSQESQSRNYDTETNEVFRIGNEIYTSITYFKSNWKLFNVFIPAFILNIAGGIVISWSLYIQPYFSHAKFKGISTIFFVGSIFGALVVAITIFKIEKKKFNYVGGIFFIIHGLLLLIAYNDIYGHIIGNLLSGLAYGLNNISSGVHTSEISINSKRGRNIASLQVGITIGILIGLEIYDETTNTSSISTWFWTINGIILILCGILSICGTYCFFIESSSFWIYKGNNTEARNIMLKYRNEIYETFDIVNDLQMLNIYASQDIQSVNNYIPIFHITKEKYLKFLKIALIRIAFVFGTGLTLNTILISYERLLIAFSGGVDIYILPRLFTEVVIIIFIDRFGRRWFLILSSIASGILLIAINSIMIYSQASTSNNFSYSTLLAEGILTIFYQFFLGFGLSISPKILTVEIFDFHSKPFFNYLLLVLEHICYIVVLLYLNTQYFSISAYFFITAFLQISAGLLTWYYIKETKRLNILTSSMLFK